MSWPEPDGGHAIREVRVVFGDEVEMQFVAEFGKAIPHTLKEDIRTQTQWMLATMNEEGLPILDWLEDRCNMILFQPGGPYIHIVASANARSSGDFIIHRILRG